MFLAQTVFVSLSASNTENLGAFQATVSFDPAVLSLVSATSGPFLGSTGRTVLCQTAPSNGSVEISCVTLGSTPPPGVSGAGDLAGLTFTSVGAGSTSLTVSDVLLTDPAGVAAPAPVTIPGVVLVDSATPTPCPGACPTQTPSPTPTPTIPSSGSPILRISPASGSGAIGAQVSFDVMAEDLSNLGAFQIKIVMSQGVAAALEAVPGPFLSSSGRTVFCLSPQILPGSITFGCASLGPSLSGASGTGVLATVALRVTSPGSTSLTLSATLTDPQGLPVAAATINGTLSGLSGPTATPTSCPGACPTATPSPTATPVGPPPTFPVTCSSASAVVCVQPVDQSASISEVVQVGVVAASVTNVGAFQFALHFDPTVIAPLGVYGGSFLGSSGRQPLCLPPVFSSGAIAFSCVTLGSQPAVGASGTGVLALATFQIIGEGATAVTLQSVLLTNPSGLAITTLTENGSVTGAPCDGPCPTATNTPLPTVTPTPAPVSCPGANMCLAPSTQNVTAGDTFTVDVIADNASNIGSYEFDLAFDGLRVVAVSVADSGFLGSTGRSVVCPSPLIGSSDIDFGCATFGGPGGPEAPAVLATITFSAVLPGTSTLHFTKSTMSDPLANPITVVATDGSVTIQ